MPIPRSRSIVLALVLFVIATTANAASVRFLSAPNVCQIRVQVFSAAGELLADSSWHDGNLIDVPMSLLDGTYRCAISVKDIDGEVTAKDSVLIARGGEMVADANASSDPKVTIVAHDDETGSVITGSGDLTFRFGNVLAAKDVERMRITADGKVGIGTDKPQAPLDVHGAIRTSEGIEFPDGTILTTAAGLPGSGSTTNQPPRNTPQARQPAPIENNVLPAAPAGKMIPTTTVGPASQFVVDGAGVHIGTTTAYGLDVKGNVILSSNLSLPDSTSALGVIKSAGDPFIWHQQSGHNTFVGSYAGIIGMTGTGNTGIGDVALQNNSAGLSNTAVGYQALKNPTVGNYNTAVGSSAAASNNGYDNSAFGYFALQSGSGSDNTAMGYRALNQNGAGSGNTALGADALGFGVGGGTGNTALGSSALAQTTGSYNIGIGNNAGLSLTTGSYNIDIDNAGAAAESNTIRIGTSVNHNRAFIAGIKGIITGSATAIPVLVDNNGQLGTLSSSRRFKFDIRDAGESTSDMMRLRPVTFRYIAHGAEAPLQYGLIAEEVADIYPEMVARDQNGDIETVMYQFLPPMLLNEFQKQHRKIDAQQQTIEDLRATVSALAARLAALERRGDRQ